MNIRQATQNDVNEISQIEANCFPEAEAADYASIKERLHTFSNHFWVGYLQDQMIGFIGGMVTDERTIQDEMYENASLHKEDGAWQSVFGLDVLEAYRNQGYAAKLMECLIEDARSAGRRGCILTCKKHLVSYYEKFGYECQGISASVHGGAVWYDMILEF